MGFSKKIVPTGVVHMLFNFLCLVLLNVLVPHQAHHMGTRLHYPERRSAFTHIDEERPTRMDYGKEKFGAPFTEEEVEDVKTVLRLLPLVIIMLDPQCEYFGN